MITEKMIKTVNYINNCMKNGLTDDLAIQITTTNLQEIGEALLEDDDLPKNEELVTYDEMLKAFIDFCSYIENETDDPVNLSDEVYDKLVEKLIDLGITQPIGAPIPDNMEQDKRPHQYPELRGSLGKVHFIWDKDIPEKDSRKSLEGYLTNAVRQLKDAGFPIGKTKISLDLKYDGVSQIMECKGETVEHVLTRGDVEKNLGKDLTPLFEKFFPELKPTIYNVMVPEALVDNDYSYGVKVETYMKTDSYEDYKEAYNVKRCNRRSAVVSICNQLADGVEENDKSKDYLSMQQFQISTEEDISSLFNSFEESHWYPIGKINDRYQYLFLENVEEVDLSKIDQVCKHCSKRIEELKKSAEGLNIPIDGIVFTFTDPKIVEILGRNHNKNLFQIAFKFPAGEKKTIVEKVDFQVGPIAGNIIPMARLKPIKINGNTISNVTLSNKEKMERLKIHEGDEVIIKYDIIPTIFKDDTCKESDNPLVEFPTTCPICGGSIEDERCINADCSAKTVGHIYNFVKRNRIGGGIGINSIIDFVEAGVLNSIGDLYRLYREKENLYKLPGYGPTSIDNILAGISESRKMYAHQLFGSLGIPTIGIRVMENVCRNVNLVDYLSNLDALLDKLQSITGIGAKRADLIIEGLKSKIEVVQDLLSNLELLSYENAPEITEVVCFTNVRDPEFEKFLIDKNIGVSNSFTSKVTLLVTPDEMTKSSTKVKKAEEKGVEILPISKAYERFGYQK
jgi:NAD-dependent DNA ligase